MRFLLIILSLLINSCTSSQLENTNTVKFKNGSTVTYLIDVEEYDNEFPIISWDEAIAMATNKKILDVPIIQQNSQNLPDSDGAVGWCGQASLQMVLAYHGIEVTQLEINNANKSNNPTIYFEDMVPVIENVTNNTFKSHMARFWSVDTYKDWIKNQINNGKPVIAVFKLNPTKTPQWLIDHFSVISGYDDNGIYILTTWSGEYGMQYRTWNQLLATRMNGLSFVGSLDWSKYLFIAFDIYQ